MVVLEGECPICKSSEEGIVIPYFVCLKCLEAFKKQKTKE